MYIFQSVGIVGVSIICRLMVANGTCDITEVTRFLGISESYGDCVWVEEFDSNHEDWPQYMEWQGYFFDAKGIEGTEKKCSVLLTLIRAATCNFLCSLVAPSKLGENTYQELIVALTAHFSPTPLPIVCRFRSHSCCWLARQVHCCVHPSTLLSVRELWVWRHVRDTLQDWLVCGIHDNVIQKKCLPAEHDLNIA